MSLESSEESSKIIWEGNPWIVPNLIFRSVIIFAVLSLVIWLEFFLGIVGQEFLGISIAFWMVFLFFIVWVIGISNLFWIRSANTYILREGSLEIETGIVTTRSFMIAPSGFDNMEVVQTLVSKLLNTGDIIIRTQDDLLGDKRMIMIHNVEEIADKIRKIMSQPVVRVKKDFKDI